MAWLRPLRLWNDQGFDCNCPFCAQSADFMVEVDGLGCGAVEAYGSGFRA